MLLFLTQTLNKNKRTNSTPSFIDSKCTACYLARGNRPCSAHRGMVPPLPPTRNADVSRPGPGSAQPGASATSENHPGSPQYGAVTTAACRQPSVRTQRLSEPSNSELDRWAPKPPAGHPDGRKERRLLKISTKMQKQKPNAYRDRAGHQTAV